VGGRAAAFAWAKPCQAAMAAGGESAIHEAAHSAAAECNDLPNRGVFDRQPACLRAGLNVSGSTANSKRGASPAPSGSRRCSPLEPVSRPR